GGCGLRAPPAAGRAGRPEKAAAASEGVARLGSRRACCTGSYVVPILRRLTSSAVLVGVALSCAIALSQSARALLAGSGDSCRGTATRVARLELLFGMSRPDGRTIAKDEWQAFIDTEVTPRFPDGLTVMTGSGQWLGSAGAITKEPSHMLTVWY